MGMMRFRVFPRERITEEMVQQAYLSGLDRTPWPVRTSIEGGQLVISRSLSDSANVHILWPVEGHGQVVLSSGSLIERPEPYELPLELARGTIVQVRNQLSEWEVIGLAVPAAAYAKLATAVKRFSRAAVGQEDAAASVEYADEALVAALDAANLLSAAYADQALALRRRSGGQPPLLLGADLGPALLDDPTSRRFLVSFNTAEVPICWRDVETTEGRFSWTTSDKQIEWCRANGLKVVAGPLLLMDPRVMPDWLYLFEEDFESVLDFSSALVRAAVLRYRGQVDYWICAGRVNVAEVLGLSEHERLRLAARTVELVRSLDPDTPALVSFDQPWAEYLRERHSDFPALHFADALVRAGLDLAGLMLEINLGLSPGGTLPRHVLELNRQLDAWSRLGLPLWLSLSAPGGEGDDPMAQRKATLPPENWTAADQRDWAARWVPLALAKPAVQGVVWNQLDDGQPHDFPHGGLLDARGQIKSALRTLAALKQKYLK
jgi:hypothetical protein